MVDFSSVYNLQGMKTYTSHAEAIRTAMKFQKVTQNSLCEKVGYSQANLSSFLNGRRPMPGDMIEKIMFELGIKLVIEE